jgi:hypothetical protein
MAAYDNVRDDTVRQLRQLREQVNDLMEERVSPVLSDAADRATIAAKRARAFTSDQADYVTDRVRDQPLIAGRLTR